MVFIALVLLNALDLPKAVSAIFDVVYGYIFRIWLYFLQNNGHSGL